MLKLGENEKIIIVVHKHWFVMARMALLILFLLLAPTLVLSLLPLVTQGMDAAVVGPVTNFLLSLYLMALLLFFFLFWADYYLDMWIITNERLIDVEQHGLFSREISEIPLIRVQDVTIEVKGIIETFLEFGTIRIQTAGEREFVIHDAPRLYEIKDTLLAHTRGKTFVEGGRAVSPSP